MVKYVGIGTMSQSWKYLCRCYFLELNLQPHPEGASLLLAAGRHDTLHALLSDDQGVPLHLHHLIPHQALWLPCTFPQPPLQEEGQISG